jgi:hypothetical protein
MAAPGNIHNAPEWLSDQHTNDGLRPPEPSILQNVSTPIIFLIGCSHHRHTYSEMAAPANTLTLQRSLAPNFFTSDCSLSIMKSLKNNDLY